MSASGPSGPVAPGGPHRWMVTERRSATTPWTEPRLQVDSPGKPARPPIVPHQPTGPAADERRTGHEATDHTMPRWARAATTVNPCQTS